MSLDKIIHIPGNHQDNRILAEDVSGAGGRTWSPYTEIVKMLDQSVMELQMNYLDEVKKSQADDTDAAADTADTDATADTADDDADDEGEAK